jgi:polyhydroxybutyrate depolymerase
MNYPIPLVISLHGDGFPAVNSYTHKHFYASDMDQKSDEEGFIVVYPNGGLFFYKYMIDYPLFLLLIELLPLLTFSKQWNHWNISEIDDVGFIRNIIINLQTTLDIDSSRIYITGLSGGAMMTYQLGSELSDIIAAIAPVAGASGGINSVPEPDDSLPIYTVPKPMNPLPIMILYGMNDISYNGGWFNFLKIGPYNSWGYLLSAEESVSLWIDYNDCNHNPEITESENDRIIKKTYNNEVTNADVVFVTYLDGGP